MQNYKTEPYDSGSVQSILWFRKNSYPGKTGRLSTKPEYETVTKKNATQELLLPIHGTGHRYDGSNNRYGERNNRRVCSSFVCNSTFTITPCIEATHHVRWCHLPMIPISPSCAPYSSRWFVESIQRSQRHQRPHARQQHSNLRSGFQEIDIVKAFFTVIKERCKI